MQVLFFISVTLALILLQTIVLPQCPFFGHCFDLMIIQVLFLSLISGHWLTLAAVGLIGVIMDSMSGAPFSYYLFSYLWIYILVFLVRQFFFQRSVVFILVMSVVSVGIQQLLLVYSMLVMGGEFWLDHARLFNSLLGGVVVIPPGIWLMEVLLDNWLRAGQAIGKRWRKARDG